MRIQTSVFGKVLPIVYGTNRIPANLIWYGGFFSVAQNAGGGGGKGGGGGGKGGQVTSYSYYTSLAMALCEGPITTIGQVWQNKSQTWLSSIGLTQYLGTYPQSPWPYLTSNFPGQDLNYAGVAYIVGQNYALGGSPETPQHSFEVYGRLVYNMGTVNDAEPSAILSDFLTNANYGVPGFTAGMIGDLTAYMQYCVANGIFISPVIDTQVEARQFLKELFVITNSAPVWSEGKLKVVPYGDVAVTGNGQTFTPNLTAVYLLSDDDFIAAEGSAPISCDRRDPADVYNQLSVECVDRDAGYISTPVEAKDQGYIDTYGYNPTPSVVQAHEICSLNTGRLVAQLLLQRQIYQGRNVYTFTLPVNFCLLEPMDLLEISDPELGLTAELIRILTVEEADSDKGDITIVAEDVGIGSGSAPQYASPAPLGYVADYNIDPGSLNSPVFMEAPVVLTTAGLELWVSYSSPSAYWGGADVYTSLDDATYKFVGRYFGKSRTGVLSTALASHADPDTVDTLSVDLSNSEAALTSGTQLDADTAATLCYVDGEFISYETATLTAAYNYNLTYLRRGWYNSNIGSHIIGSKFVRLDDAIIKVPYTSDLVGSSIWVKMVPFNIFGSYGTRSLDTEPAYQYTLQGTALLSPLAAPTDVTTRYIAGYTNISWTPVTDFREPDYEVRKGTSWSNGIFLGRVTSTNPAFITQGDGTYWVATHYKSPDGLDIYSTAVDVVLTGSVLTNNVVRSYDQVALGWPGTLSGNAGIAGSDGLVLMGAGNILADPDYLNTADIFYYGGVAPSGGYQIPVGERVDIQRVAACNIVIDYSAFGKSIYDNILSVPDVLTFPDYLDSAAGQKVTVTPQIRISQDNGTTWGAWMNYAPGSYVGRTFDMQMLLASSDVNVFPSVTALTFTVDVPDRIDADSSVNVPIAGLSVTYASPFNGGPNNSATPAVSVAILNAVSGDTVVFSSSTVNGFALTVVNGGSAVQRTISWIAQGY